MGYLWFDAMLISSNRCSFQVDLEMLNVKTIKRISSKSFWPVGMGKRGMTMTSEVLPGPYVRKTIVNLSLGLLKVSCLVHHPHNIKIDS